MRATSRTVSAASSLLGLLFVTACALPEAPPDERYYRLEAVSPERVFDQPPIDGTVEVARFSSAAMTDDRALVFSEDGGESLQRYSYHLWTDAPTIMIQGALTDTLSAANAAERVVTPELRIQSDYRLDGRLLRLEHHLAPAEGQVIAVMQIGLRGVREDDFVLLQTYREEVEVPDEGANAAARSMQTAFERILNRFLADLDDTQVTASREAR